MSFSVRAFSSQSFSPRAFRGLEEQDLGGVNVIHGGGGWTPERERKLVAALRAEALRHQEQQRARESEELVQSAANDTRSRPKIVISNPPNESLPTEVPGLISPFDDELALILALSEL